MHDHLNRQVVTATAVQDFNTTGDKLTVGPFPFYVDIIKFGYVTQDTQDPDAGGFQLDLDRRPTAGSDAGRTAAQDFILREDALVVVAKKVVYKEVVIPVAETDGQDALGGNPFGQASRINVGPAGPLVLAPGEQAVLEVTNTVGAASTGWPFVEFLIRPLISDVTILDQ